uniref:Post-GPI attachment to proteins 6 n=1 Tax=Equus caballus TaxID=9796 RepID=A0A9L0REL9_HORSE
MGRAGTGTGGAAVAVAVAGPLLLLLLLARPPPGAAGDSQKGDVRLVSEQFSQSPQKLSFYSWYGSARLFHFRVPPDAVLLRWLLQVSWGSSPTCTNVEITVYFRYGAPPVINPLGTSFPANTSVQPSFFIKMLQSNASVNISHPAPGDWFVVAHLPPSSQKIEVKDFVPTCAYVFQPDMLVVRVVEVSVLEPDVPLPQNLLSHPSYLKIFVPKYTQELRLELQGCVSNGSLGCPVRLTVGSATLPSNFQKVLTCTGPTQACRLLLPSPPWDRWLQVTAKSLAGPHVSVAFSAVAALTACRVWNMNVQPLLPSSLNQSCNISTGLMSPSPSYQDQGRNSRLGNGPFCLMSYAVTREDVDVVSVRFRPLDRVLVLVQSDTPSVMQLYLNTGMDSGGSLTISLWANQSLITKNSWVVACVNAASPFLSFNTSLNCTTAFFQGYPLFLSASSREANLIIPYPETDTWYLSLQLVCPESPEECVEAVVFVESALSLVPCLHDCGPYGQCLLLRRHGYLYAGCSCKAGEGRARRPPDSPALGFPALCLPLGHIAALPRLKSACRARADASPRSPCLPIPHAAQRGTPEMALPPDLGLPPTPAHSCPRLPHTRLYLPSPAHTCSTPAYIYSHLPTPAPYLSTSVPHLPTLAYACLIPVYTCPHLPSPVLTSPHMLHTCLHLTAPIPHLPTPAHTCPIPVYTCPHQSTPTLTCPHLPTSTHACPTPAYTYPHEPHTCPHLSQTIPAPLVRKGLLCRALGE